MLDLSHSASTPLMDSKELQGCVIPDGLLDYCLELSNEWRRQGHTELALLATESGMLVCSPAVPERASQAFNNVRHLLRSQQHKEATTVFASAANIRALLHEAERRHRQLQTEAALSNSQTQAQQTLIDLVSEALRMKASDIHLRFTPILAYISFRVKGRLVGKQRRNREAMVESIAASLNTCSNDYRQVFNEDSVDSASIELDVNDSTQPSAVSQKVRLRLQKSPLNNGFAVTLRLLPERSHQPLNFTQLGMSADVQAGIHELLKQQHGLILIVGATGHGKTTSLAALNQCLPGDKKVISLEDPVEIVQANIEQRWVDGEHACFAEHIKIALREDPDVISISEIRDPQTAAAAVTAALTGHLVTATLHAHDCIGAIQRLQNLGININELVAQGVLQGIVAQHLIHHAERTLLVAEYVLLDFPARRFLRRGDYNGWREHLLAQGWQSLRQRCQQQGLSDMLNEPARTYCYQADGPIAR